MARVTKPLKPLQQWSVQDVAQFLAEIELNQDVVDLFRWASCHRDTISQRTLRCRKAKPGADSTRLYVVLLAQIP